MRKPRNADIVVATLLAMALAAPARAAGPPVTEWDEPAPPSAVSALTQTAYALAMTASLNPRSLVKRTPPPGQPQPLVVRPPTPTQPDDKLPTDPPPTLQETPEPGTMVIALLGGSLSLMAAWRQRRKKPIDANVT